MQSLFRKTRKRTVLLCFFLTAFLSAGCKKEVVTVLGDNGTDGEGAAESPVIEKFEKKTVEEENLIRIGSVVLQIPEGYVRSKQTENLYVSPLYPLDSSNIYYTRSDGHDVGMVDGNLTGEQYREAITEAFEAEGKSVDLQIDDFQREDKEGVPFFKIRSHYVSGDHTVQMLTLIVSSAETYVITYTQLSDDELMADFLTEEGSIRLIKEISGE
ncbi:MAG: hypothetical protein K6F53_06240 [Lachnospiraceae bacterium]|nr:hypothetical protein [Lachnospiraceae bacterium]